MENRVLRSFCIQSLGLIILLFLGSSLKAAENQTPWPKITKVTKPWARWWWMGSAVDEANLTNLISKYKEAGFGGLEITPIYGAGGFEQKYLSYLSPGWMKMLDVSVREAAKNGMGIDMNLGTGWPFGGPQVTLPSAATKLILQKYQLKKGERLTEKIVPSDKKQPAEGIQLQAVTAYNPDGKTVDLTKLVDKTGTLNWKAASSDWDIYAAFSGKTLQKVKRAAPGGEGLTFDPFSKQAFQLYLSRFDSAFQKSTHGVGSFFNDSYEVYGTNWTPLLLEEFLKRRGYSLQPYLRELSEKVPSSDRARRVQCDYRETISDLLLENFTQSFTKWAHQLGSLTRNQAHGSPGNLLDLYAAVDIPECETFGSSNFNIPGLRRDSSDIRNVDPDPVMMKFASSAANVSGKKLASSETFTWLAEHFRVSLSQCKPEVEQVFLSGINHVYYHGATYSPAEAGWPGWLFYASVNFAPSNSFWPHLSGLNNYIARCQSILQEGVPDNDLLVYWPVYDVWMKPESADLQLTIHSIDKWLWPSPFYADVKAWMKQGYTLDFTSDRLLNGLSVKNGLITTKSGSSYRSLVIPACSFIPVSTAKRILEIARQGATVIFQQLPGDVPGLNHPEARRKQLKELISLLPFTQISDNSKTAKCGKGEITVANEVVPVLERKMIASERLVDSGLKYLRRKSDQGVFYYLVNHTPANIDQFLPLNEMGKNCLLLDPQSGSAGWAQTSTENGKIHVHVQLRPGEALFVLLTDKQFDSNNWKYLEKSAAPIEIGAPWTLAFKEGGALLPGKVKLQHLVSWTELPDVAVQNFSGTGRYSASFELPEKLAGEYLLDPGKVCESTRVWINGQDAGILWSIPFTTRIKKYLKPGKNSIDFEVANLMANRIRQMDLQKVPWRNYHEINFVNIDYKSFDASGWKPMPSGLLGPVGLIPYE